MSFNGIIAIVVGVLIVAWIIDNIGGGNDNSGHTIGDFKDTVDKI